MTKPRDEPFPLGTPVRFTQVLLRFRDEPKTRRWRPWPVRMLGVQREFLHGVVVGRRTLHDGRVIWGYDEPTTFIPAEPVDAYLVSWDQRRDIVKVLPEHLEFWGEDDQVLPTKEHRVQAAARVIEAETDEPGWSATVIARKIVDALEEK